MSSWKPDAATRFLHVQGRVGPLDLTEQINEIVRQSEVSRGLCYLFTPHRETGLAVIDESQSDYASVSAFAAGLRNQVTLSVVDRRLFLGPGQRVVLWETETSGDRLVSGRRRRVLVRVMPEVEAPEKAAAPEAGPARPGEYVAESAESDPEPPDSEGEEPRMV